MNELSIEQKAKAYDEALERAKKINNEHKAQPFDVMLKVFPELKEGEDEEHCKWILAYLYNGLRKSDEQFKGQFKAAIDWLEKQNNKPKSLKERYTWKPSDEQIRHLQYACENGTTYSIDVLKELLRQLKALL